MSEDRSALGTALAMLSRRDYTSADLRARLVRKGHTDDEARQACERCREYGYLDDHAFGVARVRALLRRRPSGRALLLHDLRRQGLPRTMCERIVAEAYEEAGGESEVLGDALQRWIAKHGDPTDWRAAQRCSAHLSRRGFSAGSVQTAMSPWLDRL